MDAPQSWEEVGPVVRALQGMDGLLDIRWNPCAFVLDKGAYSVTGKLTPPTYAGRWEVIRYQTASRLHAEREYTVICTVTKPQEFGGVLCLVARGEYMPIGEWLVDFMRSADAANVRHMTELRTKLWAHDEVLDHARDSAEEAMAREALDRVHFDAVYAGGVGNWQGKGTDFTPTQDA